MPRKKAAKKRKIAVGSHSRDYYPGKLPPRAKNGRFKKRKAKKRKTSSTSRQGGLF